MTRLVTLNQRFMINVIPSNLCIVLTWLMLISFPTEKAYSFTSYSDDDNCKYLKKRDWIGEKRGSNLTIELDAIAIADYEILLDGIPYTGIFKPYEKKKVHFYNLTELNSDVFYVHEFISGTADLKGKFDNVLKWVGYLNIYSSIEWFWDGTRGLLYNTEEDHLVGNMIVSKMEDKGNLIEFPVSSVEISKNVIIEIPKGKHKVTIHNFVRGCSETKEIEV